MARIDYFDDPEAPPANSLVPSANVVVVDDTGRVLLIHRDDNDNWAVPGGAMDLGESLVDCGVRETLDASDMPIYEVSVSALDDDEEAGFISLVPPGHRDEPCAGRLARDLSQSGACAAPVHRQCGAAVGAG
jgi:hypothetical protein